MKTILIVCTANICRSPMAAALLQRHCAELGLADRIRVVSGGVWARDGQEASKVAVEVLAERGLSLADHRSQPISLPLLEEADLVLVMEEAHRRSLFYLAPQYLHKVYLLGEMAGRHEDIADPYGSSAEAYRQTVQLLDRLIEKGMPQILKRLGMAEEAECVTRHA